MIRRSAESGKAFALVAIHGMSNAKLTSARLKSPEGIGRWGAGSTVPVSAPSSSITAVGHWTLATSGCAASVSITRAAMSGASASSASRNSTTSASATAKPALNADAWPPFGFSTGVILSPYEAITAREPSVEPSSTTTTRTCGWVCASALSIASARKRS